MSVATFKLVAHQLFTVQLYQVQIMSSIPLHAAFKLHVYMSVYVYPSTPDHYSGYNDITYVWIICVLVISVVVVHIPVAGTEHGPLPGVG